MRALLSGLPHVLAVAVCVALAVALVGRGPGRAVVVDLPVSAPARVVQPGDSAAASMTADDVARGVAALARSGQLTPEQRSAMAASLAAGAEARAAREAGRAAARRSRREALARGREIAEILGKVPE